MSMVAGIERWMVLRDELGNHCEDGDNELAATRGQEERTSRINSASVACISRTHMRSYFVFAPRTYGRNLTSVGVTQLGRQARIDRRPFHCLSAVAANGVSALRDCAILRVCDAFVNIVMAVRKA